MRILHLSSVYAPDAMGGAERVVEMLAEGSSARPGVEVAVAHIAPQPRPPAKRHGVDIFPLAHRNPLWITDSAKYPGPVRNLNKIATLFNLLSAGDLARLLKQYRPDVVHSHSMVELPPRMWAVAREAGAAVVHTLHDYDLLCIRAALFKDGQRCVQRHASCAAFSRVKRYYHTRIQSVVGVSQAILQTHLDDGLFAHVPEANRHVVWNPVPLAPPTGVVPTLTARRGPLVFGFMGRLVAEKGIHTLLEACRQLGGTGWELKIAGRAPKDDPSLQALAQGLPIEFAGFVDPAAFLREIDVLVVPSIWLEPFGLTIIEAYAAGVPVIGADIAGVAELVRSVDPAALVPPGDATALAEALRRMVAAGRGAIRLPDASALLQRTKTTFVVDSYLDVYRAALGASGPRTR